MTSIEQYTGSLFGLRDKVALVTGGAAGLGYMITHALVAAGARVYIASRKLDTCREAAARLGGLAGEVIPFGADLSAEEGVLSLSNFITGNETGLDILVNNSGRSWGADYEHFPWQAWSDVMTLNVTAPFTLTRALTPLLAAAAAPGEPSRVINIGSIMGWVPHGYPAYSYSASKAALHHLTRILSNELAPWHIAVNAIAPGPFPSRMTAFFSDSEKRTNAVTRAVPLGRLGKADDVAGLILCLCGTGGAYISGAIIPLDGGMNSARTPGLEQGLD